MQALRESRETAVLNEWARTCLPPQNENVSKNSGLHMQIYPQNFLDELYFPFSLGYAIVGDD